MNETGTVVGSRLPQSEAAAKAAGSAIYVDDISRPGMLYGALTPSPHAHARIRGYDTRAARAVPGVMAIVTGEDFGAVRGGVFVKDEPPIATGKVRYLGEPVAAVAAVDEATARRAARLVEVDYEPLAPVLSFDDALAPEAALVHEELESYARLVPSPHRGNVLWEVTLGEGDVEAAWAECDVVVEGEFETHAQHHVYLEPCTALAEPDPDGRLTIWSSCQSVHMIQQKVADLLGMPMAKVRAVVTNVGGGFGGKGGLHVQHLAGKLALTAGRPVKITLARSEDFEMVRSRHPGRIRMKTGARRDGTLLARSVEILFDGGAYADESPPVLSFAALMARGPYRIANLRCHGRVVYTNKLKAGPYRGFGNPQVTFAGESQIDEIAARLDMDPLELRSRNAVDTGDRWVGGQQLASCGLRECLERLKEAARPARAEPAPAGKRRGIGYAAFTHTCGLHSTAAQVHLRADGSIAVVTGVVDIGQGSSTALAQIAAEPLALPLERVSFSTADTDSSPYNWKTAASRTTYMGGRAVLAATLAVRDQILEHAAEMLECSVEDLELLAGGEVGVRGSSDTRIPYARISQRALARRGGPIMGSHSLLFDGEPLDPKRAIVEGFAFSNLGIYIFGAQAVEVEVDEATGEVRVLRAWSAHDVGRAINPMMVEGQIQGGFVQGMGLTLTEEMIWDDDGRLVNPSLMDYKVPGMADAPPAIVPIIVEDPEPTGPYGAKGVAEASLVGVPAVIANAVADAIGTRMHRLPLTSERVLEALRTAGA